MRYSGKRAGHIAAGAQDRKVPTRRCKLRSLAVPHLLVAMAAFKAVNAGASAQHPVLVSDFLVRCQETFKRCEDRVVDVAISLIMTNNPEFCDPKKDDPEELTRRVTDWMSSRPEQPGETATQGIADALLHVRPCTGKLSLQQR